MSVEDGAVLGILIGKLDQSGRFGACNVGRGVVSSVLELYESIRIPRTSQIVKVADETRYYYFLEDGEAQRERDEFLSNIGSRDWTGSPRWMMAPFEHQHELLGLNIIADAEDKFDDWLSHARMEPCEE